MKYTNKTADGFYFSYGEKGLKNEKTKTIVFIHGFTADHFMWAPIVKVNLFL